MKCINITRILLFFSLFFMFYACKNKAENNNHATEATSSAILEETKQTASKHAAPLPTVNIQAHDKMVSPTVVEVNSQGLWLASEGTIGQVKLFNDAGKELASGMLTTSENWMTNEPVLFSTNLVFDSKDSRKGTLIIYKDPGSGDNAQVNKRVNMEIPVVF